ncbi:hypothetical protein LXL04_007564 [Taraxacum kok-saghyz]
MASTVEKPPGPADAMRRSEEDTGGVVISPTQWAESPKCASPHLSRRSWIAGPPPAPSPSRFTFAQEHLHYRRFSYSPSSEQPHRRSPLLSFFRNRSRFSRQHLLISFSVSVINQRHSDFRYVIIIYDSM